MGEKPNPKDFMFMNNKGETLIKKPGQINGLDFVIDGLEDCEVYLLDHSAQVFIDYCKNCKIFIGPVDGAVFARNCDDCVFTVACRQFRTRETNRCKVNLYVASDPIIESSSEMKFGPFNGAYPGLDEHFKAANLNPADNHYSAVYNFTPQEGRTDFEIMAKNEFKSWNVPIDGNENYINPVPLPESGIGITQLKPTLNKQDSASDMKSFDIHTSQAEAEATMTQGEDMNDDFLAPTAPRTGPSMSDQSFDDFLNDDAPVSSTVANGASTDDFDLDDPFGEAPKKTQPPQQRQEEEEEAPASHVAPSAAPATTNMEPTLAVAVDSVSPSSPQAQIEQQTVFNPPPAPQEEEEEQEEDTKGATIDFSHPVSAADVAATVTPSFDEEDDFDQYTTTRGDATSFYSEPVQQPDHSEQVFDAVESAPVSREDAVFSMDHIVNDPYASVAAPTEAFVKPDFSARYNENERKEKDGRDGTREKARKDLDEFYRNRTFEQEKREKNNKEAEWAFVEGLTEHLKLENSWEKVTKLIDMTDTARHGGKDVSRMRQVIIAKKQDTVKAAHK